MKLRIFILFASVCGILMADAQEKTVSINGYTWTTTNAVIKTFRNGDAIPFAKDESAFTEAATNGKPAWRHINYDASNEPVLGIEYNHYVLTDSRGFAPDGWRVPTKDEFSYLVGFFGGIHSAGNKVVKTDTDNCGFSVIADFPSEDNLRSGACYWTSTMDVEDAYWFFYVDGGAFMKHSFEPGAGLSVRFVKTEVEEKENSKVRIGNQIWDSKNLAVTQFNNGDPIKECKTPAEWEKANKSKEPAYCHYHFDAKLSVMHGLIYNYYAVNDARGLAPKNYHIPTEADWKTLAGAVKGDSRAYCAGKKMKDLNQWPRKNYCQEISSESSGFNAIASGFIDKYGMISEPGQTANFWIAGASSPDQPKTFCLSADYDHYNIFETYPDRGMMIRCMMNEDYFQSSSNPMQTVTSNSVEIMNKNLNVSFYRNGDSIPQANSAEEWESYNRKMEGAWCYFNFDPANGEKYGKMYNMYAIRDSRNVAPLGWKIPMAKEMEKLIEDKNVAQTMQQQMGGAYEYESTGLMFVTETKWWTLNPEKQKRAFYVVDYSSYMTSGWTTSNSNGCYIRCIKE